MIKRADRNHDADRFLLCEGDAILARRGHTHWNDFALFDLERLGAQPGDMRDTYADSSKARTDLGFAPAVTLDQGLRAEYDWMIEAGLL